MRRRIGSALALWALVGLGHAGCATQSKRAEAPAQFRLWKDPSGTPTASTKAPAPASSPAPAQSPDLISSLLGQPASAPMPTPGGGATTKDRAVASEIPASSVRPRYRPGSWLFRRFNKPAATPSSTPPGDPGGSLARFFPTLYGKSPVDAARLAQVGRPQIAGPGLGAGRSPGLSGASIEMTRNTMAPASDEPPLLADGIPVRAYPRAPSPSLPPSEALAAREEPTRAAEPAAPGERLTSHEETESLDTLAPRKRDLIDALSTHLEPATPRRETKPQPAPAPEDAPSDPDGRATSATVEVPSPRDVAPLLDVVQGLSSPDTAAKPSEPLSPPEAKRPESRPATGPALGGRPRAILAPSAELPDPEFPATYHAESLRQVARETPRLIAPPSPIPIRPAPAPTPPAQALATPLGPVRGGEVAGSVRRGTKAEGEERKAKSGE